MSRAKRRRKVSTTLAFIASVPLVAGVAIQELGVVPPQGAVESCQTVLGTDLPACSIQDFTTTCSSECSMSIAGVANSLLETCTSALTSTQIGPLFSPTGQLLLCSSSATPEPVTTTAPDTPPDNGRARVESPFVPPFPAGTSEVPPAPVLSAVVSNIIPHIPAPSDVPPSNARSTIVSSGGNSPFIPPFVIPAPSSPPSPVLISPDLDDSSPIIPTPQPNILLPGTLSTTAVPTVSIIAGPALIGGQVPPPTTLQTISIAPGPTAGSPEMSFILQPTPPNQPQSPQSPTSPSNPQRPATSSTTADNANLGTAAMPTADQMRQVNPGIIGGVVGGGLGAISAAVALIYFLSRRRRKARESRDSGPRRAISSWDFIDSNRGLESSSGASAGGGSVGFGKGTSGKGMEYLEKPIFLDVNGKGVQKPQQVVIKRVSGPPVIVRPGSIGNGAAGGEGGERGGVVTNPASTDRAYPYFKDGRASGASLDERTVEALGMTMKSAKTKYTASQYSRNSMGASSIIVGYQAPEPVPQINPNTYSNANTNTNTGMNTTPNMGMTMMGGSPGPTVYRGSATTVGGGNGMAEQRRYPSPIDEEPELPSMYEVPMPRRSTFYDPFMGERTLRASGGGGGYTRR